MQKYESYKEIFEQGDTLRKTYSYITSKKDGFLSLSKDVEDK